jgi:hypothetical protein
MNLKKTICFLACFFLTACATRISHPPAPLQQRSTVEQFQLDENESRVHFFLGEYFPYRDTNRSAKMNQAAEFYVNNVKIGLIGNNKEYTAIDLPPGIYNFKWTNPAENHRQETLQLSIRSKELIFLKANMRNNASVYTTLLGPIGALATLDIFTYLEQDPKLKNNLIEYTLVSLNKDFTSSVSTQKTELNKPQPEGEAASTTEKKLTELKSIYDKGLITKEEYDEKRKKIIEKY